MKKYVYVVTSGCYSDYGIDGIYETKELAEIAYKYFKADDIEKWELNAIPEHPEGMYPFHVNMDVNGNSTVEPEDITWFQESDDRPYGDNKQICFQVWAKDKEHAVKIANERRINLIANNKWNTDFNEWRKRNIK